MLQFAGVYEEEHRAWSISRPAQSTVASVRKCGELRFTGFGASVSITQDPGSVVLGDISALAEIDLKVARDSLDALLLRR